MGIVPPHVALSGGLRGEKRDDGMVHLEGDDNMATLVYTSATSIGSLFKMASIQLAVAVIGPLV
jgi:hypothetical protein